MKTTLDLYVRMIASLRSQLDNSELQVDKLKRELEEMRNTCQEYANLYAKEYKLP